MYEEVMEWKRMAELSSNGALDFETLVRKVSSKVVIDSFEIEGPFELRAVGKDDQLSLMLPLNTSHSGLKRISVGKGITVEVKGAEEISILHPIDGHKLPYGTNEACPALLPIQIMGSASILAYRTKRPTAYIKTVFSSREAIELLSDKCYVWPNYQKPRHLLSSIVFLEKVLRSFLSEKANSNTALGFLKSRIRASTIFRFQLEVERYIRSNDTYWSTLAEWRTRPMFERVRFEVTARIEGEILKPLIVKKVRPFIDVDSFAWSSLLSNLSFTKFPSVLVPPEALTLDVKW
ncbi:hypothetical protein ACJIZ3_024953 [Penstemon smallii]|uniref:Uncharacterized protein n=1 Tax=Penstemon smallii TaxID=265156 RepID=A0ABD3TTF5_9LAMI